ncbi:MAG: hypothetical protein Kow0081_2050 [Candidatus Dojkabacteria bacterium]
MDNIQIAVLILNCIIFICAIAISLLIRDPEESVKIFTVVATLWAVAFFILTYVLSSKNTIGSLTTGIVLFILFLTFYVFISIGIFSFVVGITNPNLIRLFIVTVGSIILFLPSYFYLYLANTCTLGRCFGS